MKKCIDNPAFLPSTAGPKSPQRGYILLVLSLFAALLAIGLMHALPTALVQTQREREEELIFRGEQYRRAVQNYVRKFGRYPNSLDDLEDTNGVRFLRRRYRDPITDEDEWRMIHIGPGGTFPDSKNSTAPPGLQPGDTGLTPSAAGAEPRGFSEQPSQFEATSGFGGSAVPPQALPAAADAPDPGQNPDQLPPALRPSADPSANPAQQPRAFGAVQQPGQPGVVAFGGGGIAGVASNSTDPSIKVYNGYLQYDEWEFIYNYQADQFGMAAVARTTGGAVPGAQPNLQPGVGGQPPVGGQPGAPPPGVMTGRGGNQVPGVPFPAPFGGPSVPPRYPAGQFPGMPPGAQPGGFPGAFPGAQPGAFPGGQPGGFGGQPGAFPGGQPGGFGAQPTPAPGAQPRSPFESRPFPGFGQPSSPSPSPSPGFGAQPGQGFPTSPIPGFPPNQQPRR